MLTGTGEVDVTLCAVKQDRRVLCEDLRVVRTSDCVSRAFCEDLSVEDGWGRPPICFVRRLWRKQRKTRYLRGQKHMEIAYALYILKSVYYHKASRLPTIFEYSVQAGCTQAAPAVAAVSKHTRLEAIPEGAYRPWRSRGLFVRRVKQDGRCLLHCEDLRW